MVVMTSSTARPGCGAGWKRTADGKQHRASTAMIAVKRSPRSDTSRYSRQTATPEAVRLTMVAGGTERQLSQRHDNPDT